MTVFTILIHCSRKKVSGIYKALTNAYVPAQLPHFTHMFQPNCLILRILHKSFNIRDQRSLIRGRGTSIEWLHNHMLDQEKQFKHCFPIGVVFLFQLLEHQLSPY